MSNLNTILNKLGKIEKIHETNLGKHEVELGIIQDDLKKIISAQKDFENAFLVISAARQKAIPIMKNSITTAEKFLVQVENAKKIAKELGVNLPKDYLDLNQKAGVLVGEAQDIIDWLNKY